MPSHDVCLSVRPSVCFPVDIVRNTNLLTYLLTILKILFWMIASFRATFCVNIHYSDQMGTELWP